MTAAGRGWTAKSRTATIKPERCQPLNPNVAKHKKVESRILKSRLYASLNDGLRLNFNSGSSNQATMRDL